jgi:type IV fimbrial biogenesis protein FimT
MRIRQRGVTMIELAVVLAVVAILFATAAPSFSTWVRNVQIRTATESMLNGLQLARAEAIRRNRAVMFWLTSTATPPAADWMVGCALPGTTGNVPEQPGDCPYTATNGTPSAGNYIQWQVAANQQTAFPQVTITPAGANNVTFSSLGMVAANPDGSASITQLDVTDPSIANARPLRIMISGGQIRMCDPALALANDPRGCT